MSLIGYRLRGREVELVYSMLEWARWFEKADRVVGKTLLALDDDGAEVLVSTVFLGLDHGHRTDGPPIVFETMVFVKLPVLDREEGAFDEAFDRYCTWDEARAGHERIVASVQGTIANMREAASAAVDQLRESSTYAAGLLKRLRETPK